MSRKLARRAAFEALFQLDFNHGEVDERELYENLAVETAVENTSESGELDEADIFYIESSVKGARKNLNEIDEIITSHLKKNWTLKRLASADRNILRLAVYELKFAESKIPKGVAINEAVELAKKYGTDDSGRFVNGILDAIAN